jgi:hypothetical protein
MEIFSFLPFWEVRYSVVGPRSAAQIAHMTAESANNAEEKPLPAKAGRKVWRTALLLAASAAFGGLAVAIWNRKILADMRNRSLGPLQPSAGREDDIY